MNYNELQNGIEDQLPTPGRGDLWEAIQNDELKKYTLKQIKQGMLQKSRSSTATLYHFAPEHGHLNKIPKELLTQENLIEAEVDGWKPIHYAAGRGHIDQIPKELLTQKNLLKPHAQNGQTPLHMAAKESDLDKIPKELLTEENLTKPDIYGWTCLHWAAVKGHLDQIPKEILTAKNLLQPSNGDGSTCLHIASQGSHLGQIPQALLTKTNLLQPDHFQEGCLDIATYLGRLNQLRFLRLETLQKLKAHFEADRSKFQKKILEAINTQIHRHKMITKSLKKEHEEIL